MNVTANPCSTNVQSYCQSIRAKQRGRIPFPNLTVSPSGRNRGEGYPSQSTGIFVDNLRVKFWKIFDFGPSKIVISAKGQFAEVVVYNSLGSKIW